MKTAAARTLYLPLGLLLAALTVTGCSQTPQEQYQDAIEALEEAREELNETQEVVQEKKEALAEVRASLAEATEELMQARQQVEAATQAIAKTVNDQVLFRAIQSALLELSRFDKAAIAVGVDNRVVTLTGSVPDEETRKAAIGVARSQPGVKNVVALLEIGDGDAPLGEGAGSTQPGPAEQAAPEQRPSDNAADAPAGSSAGSAGESSPESPSRSSSQNSSNNAAGSSGENRLEETPQSPPGENNAK